ncbi:hypothetical protein ACPA9J_27740 [Pseudomonas aeruginosa]
MLLRQPGVVDSSGGGEISSDPKLYLAATALSNRGGRVISGDSLTLRIAQALDNSLQGVLSASGGLDVAALVFDNHSGIVGSKGDTHIGVNRLENEGRPRGQRRRPGSDRQAGERRQGAHCREGRSAGHRLAPWSSRVENWPVGGR